MQQSVNKRIKLLINTLNMSQTQFSKTTDINAVSLSRIINGEHDPSPKTISKITSSYGVNVEWLVNGKGEMFVNGKPELKGSQVEGNPYRDAYIADLKTQVEYLKEMLKMALGGKTNFLQALNVPASFFNDDLRAQAAA